jgi:hypothetical protein
MKKAENDVPLHDGEGFMIREASYQANQTACAHFKQPVSNLMMFPFTSLMIMCSGPRALITRLLILPVQKARPS